MQISEYDITNEIGEHSYRIKKVLPTLINNDQTGFIAGRYIGENIRLLFDIMEYAEENDIPGLFLLIDFGECIQKWVKTFYNNIISAVNQGGNLFEFFSYRERL